MPKIILKNMVIVNCKTCGKEFKTHTNKKYGVQRHVNCSECFDRSYKICEYCGKKFKTDSNNQKYCSKNCSNNNKNFSKKIKIFDYFY